MDGNRLYVRAFWILALAALCMGWSPVQGQTADSAGCMITLTLRDGEGHQNTLHMGVHPKATEDFDVELGEVPIPPVPSVPAFDVRLLDPQLKKRFPGNGAYIDIRPYVGARQRDTFSVGFQPANGSFPVRCTWEHALGGKYRTAELVWKKGKKQTRVNMMRHDEAVLDAAVEGLTFMVILGGPRLQAEKPHAERPAPHGERGAQ